MKDEMKNGSGNPALEKSFFLQLTMKTKLQKGS